MSDFLDRLVLDDPSTLQKIEPQPDIYHCFRCAHDCDVGDCDEIEDGDWENGYYFVHACPSCGDASGEYDMSAERAEEWWQWREKEVSDD